jgi:hypothetical protein
MAPPSDVRQISVPVNRRGASRSRRRYPGPDRLLAGQVPADLSVPSGHLIEPGREIWEYPTPEPRSPHYGGGAIVDNARLVLIFWGDYWKTATEPSLWDIYVAASQILGSPYLSELEDYGFQSLTLDPPIILSPGPPTPTYTGSDAKNRVWDLIDDGHYPEPDEDNGRIVYMLFAPPGATYSSDDPSIPAAGAHGDAIDYDFPFDIDRAWVGWVDHGYTLDSITPVFTHELVEIITDPEPDSGYTMEGAPDGLDEIADFCLLQKGMVNGNAVSAYFSKRLGLCVVPSDRPALFVELSSQEEATSPTRQIGFGATPARSGNTCFSGTYTWTLFGTDRELTITAAAHGYSKPTFSWNVNGQDVFAEQSISAPAMLEVDPLSKLTTLPSETVTVTATLSSGTWLFDRLILKIKGDQASAYFNFMCTVDEEELPPGYDWKRIVTGGQAIGGRLRFMDRRYRSDLEKCRERARGLARNALKPHIYPRINLGDPPPPWVGIVSPELSEAVRSEILELYSLAHALTHIDPPLAAELRGLADATAVTAQAERLAGDGAD